MFVRVLGVPTEPCFGPVFHRDMFSLIFISIFFCFCVWTVAHPSAVSEHHLCAVSSLFTVTYTLKEREGAVHNKNHNAKSMCLSGWGLRVLHTWHKPYPQVHLSPCMDSTANLLWNPSLPSSLPVYSALSLALSLHVSLSISFSSHSPSTSCSLF